MPISDHPDYESGHFRRVFEDIFRPACDEAGFHAVLASEVGQTNLIQLDVLQKLLESPMVLCDLSSRNPNVLFELGIRQAFDKPVVLVQDEDTAAIFDIAPLRYTEYRKGRRYDEVIQDRSKISRATVETKEAFDNNEGINSIVRLLSLTQAATLVDVPEASKDPLFQLIRAELSEMRAEFREALNHREPATNARLSFASISVPSRGDLKIVSALISMIEESVGQMVSSGTTPTELPREFESDHKRIRLARERANSAQVLELLGLLQQRLDTARARYDELYVDVEDFDDIPF